MDFTLNEVQRGWQMKARKFAEEVIKPITVKCDAIEDPHETFDWDVIKKGSKLGFRTMSVPKEYGGEGTDYVTQAVVMIELARADSAVGKTFSQNWKWSHVMLASCSEDQKKRFLTEFVKDDTYLLGKGITEPNAGNDNRLPPADAPKSGSRLKAERHGDEWILNGEKCFIANGGVAKLLFVDTRTDPNAPIKTGMTVFLIPTESTPGFRYGTRYNKTGWRFYQNAELIFDNARVPDANRVGEVNVGIKKGTDDTTGGDMFGDLELCSHGVGVCQNVCDRSMQHAKTVMKGGKPLAEQQWVQLKLHRMWMLTEALKSFTMRSAWEHDAKVHTQNPGLNMNFACDTIQEVTRLGIEIVGYGGGRMNAEADKLARDALTWVHLGGDSVLRMRYARRIISAYNGPNW
jgi:alkylation response protein AidB-like acyl-CoA dehydrogenase